MATRSYLMGYIYMHLFDVATNPLGNRIQPLATKNIEEMTVTGTACVSEPSFLIVMNFSLNYRNLAVKRSGSVHETRDRALSLRRVNWLGELTRNDQSTSIFALFIDETPGYNINNESRYKQGIGAGKRIIFSRLCSSARHKRSHAKVCPPLV